VENGSRLARIVSVAVLDGLYQLTQQPAGSLVTDRTHDPVDAAPARDTRALDPRADDPGRLGEMRRLAANLAFFPTHLHLAHVQAGVHRDSLEPGAKSALLLKAGMFLRTLIQTSWVAS
jgi:hypothetical protein